MCGLFGVKSYFSRHFYIWNIIINAVALEMNHRLGWISKETQSLLCVLWLAHPGAASGSTDLLPAPSPSANWTASLLTDSGRESDLIYRFDGHQAANVPDHVVPQNLTDQFTIATWMKHGPSPGLRAEKETLLCSSDKTGEEIASHLSEVTTSGEPKRNTDTKWVFSYRCRKRNDFILYKTKIQENKRTRVRMNLWRWLSKRFLLSACLKCAAWTL